MTLSPNHTLEFSLLVNGGQLAGAVAGFVLIGALARTEKYARWLWPVTIACAFAMAGFLFFVSDPGSAFEDFRKAYWKAGAAVLHGPQALRDIFAGNVFGFVNLPIVSYLSAPFGLLPEKLGGAAFAALSGLAVLWAWRRAAALFEFTPAEQALSLFALACYGPLIHSLRQANASHLVLAMLIWGMVEVAAKREGRAGLAFGLAALIKPPLALVGVYYVLRGRWKIVGAGAALLLTSAALSLAVFGWALHVAWFEACIKPFLGGVVPAFNAQSIASALTRFELGSGVLWDWAPYAPSPLVRGLIIASSLGVTAIAFWACVKAREPQPKTELAIVLTLACVLSSLSWTHYFVWLLPGFAVLLTRTRPDADAANLRAVFLAAFALTAPCTFMTAPMMHGIYPMPLLLSSHLLIGALLTFGLLVALRLRAPAPAKQAAAPALQQAV